MTCGAAETYDVRCCRNLWRAVLPKPMTCGAAETDHGTVFPKPMTCGVVETYDVRCCRNLWRAVLPKSMMCGAAETYDMRCCQNLWHAVLQKPMTCGAAETYDVRCCRKLSTCSSGFGGLEVVCWPLVPKFAGFAPGRSRRIFRAKKILSTPSFGGEVKPSVPCRSFTACKRSLNVTCKSAFRQNLPDISRPQFHLPPLGALAWWHAWRRLVVKVGTSNPDRTISLKGCSAYLKTIIKFRCCRNLSRAVLAKHMKCGAAETYDVRCCRNLWRALLPKPITLRCCRNLSRCGAAETDHVRCCRNLSRCGAAGTYAIHSRRRYIHVYVPEYRASCPWWPPQSYLETPTPQVPKSIHHSAVT